MKPLIEQYAKRLKLSWIREHYQDIQADSSEDYLLKLMESEIKQREEQKINLLLKQATLPKIADHPFEWENIQLAPGLTKDDLLKGAFIEKNENLIFYGGVGTGKTFLASLISLNAIKKFSKKVRFYTTARLVNQLLDANEKGSLSRFFKQIEKLDLLILDELGYIPLHKQGAELLF